jgi:ArsR family transcriptional regulator, arsenate/arsenite/antimonite-responsive transcriptional repressor
VSALPAPARVKGVARPPSIPLASERVDQTVDVLRALADPTRLQVVGILKRSAQPVCICDLTAAFNLSQPTISHHMARLKESGLVDVSRHGIWSYYRLRPLTPKLRALVDLVV